MGLFQYLKSYHLRYSSGIGIGVLQREESALCLMNKGLRALSEPAVAQAVDDDHEYSSRKSHLATGQALARATAPLNLRRTPQFLQEAYIALPVHYRP